MRLLTDLTEHKALTPFRLTNEVIKVFKTLKDAFLKAPLLTHFQAELLIVMKTDTSDYTIVGILS